MGNLCHEAGCRAKCCHNIVFQMTAEEAGRIIGRGAYRRLKGENDVASYKEKLPAIYCSDRETEDVIKTRPNKTVVLVINGECPRLKENACTIYGQRPGPCKDFACSLIRKGQTAGTVN